jgi:hypothetical protein
MGKNLCPGVVRCTVGDVLPQPDRGGKGGGSMLDRILNSQGTVSQGRVCH